MTTAGQDGLTQHRPAQRRLAQGRPAQGRPAQGRSAQRAGLASRDGTELLFTGEMYGLQLDQLAELRGGTMRQARALAARWASAGLADTAVLSPGPPWVWLTRAGLQTCGLRYAPAPPALARLEHIRAVTAARLALQSVPAYRDGDAHWRSERRLRSRLGSHRGARDHLPDAEVHWPEAPASGVPPGWAGECWAIEAELTPKTVARTTAIMRELLARTADYGSPAAEARVAGLPPRHARVVYLCSAAATGTVLRARDALGSLSSRIEVRALPVAAPACQDPGVSRAPGRLVLLALAALAVAAAAVALLPVTLVAAVGVAAAWHGGWQPGRLYRAAAWCLPMLAVWLAATAISQHSLAGASPQLAWLALGRGHYLTAAVLIAPLAVPAGLLAGGLAWSYRLASMAAQVAGRSPAAAISFDDRQWRHQVRAAKALITAPGAVRLLTRRGDFVAGAVIRAVGHPARELTVLPASRLRSHQIVIGATGTGKTTLLLRLWAGYLATAGKRHAARQAGPPLIVILDCKGGADARRIADRARRVLRSAGAGNVAVWPDEACLSLWSLPTRQLISTLVDLIEHGTGGAAYYTDVMEAVVTLAVEAPCGAPASTADFLTRLDPGWLGMAYSAGGYADQLALARSAARQAPDVALRFRTLFRRLGPGLDGPGSFADADVWYCILEGTAEVAVAEAQARALVDMLASFVTQGPGAAAASDGSDGDRERQVLLSVDEFSAVARRLPIWQLYERARSLGLSVQVSAQSWHGLAPRQDDRYRLAATAEGGIWLLGTPHPDPVTALAGQRASVDTSRQLAGRLRWSRLGSSRLRERPVADPDRIRAFEPGQAAYIHHGGVTFTQIKRLVAGPAGLAAGRGQPGERPTAVCLLPATAVRPGMPGLMADTTGPDVPGAPHIPRLPDVSGLLDAAFGPPP